MSFYDFLEKKYIQKVEEIFREMKQEKERMFKYLSEKYFSDSLVDLAANNMTEKHKAFEISMLHHLKDVRNISTAAQN